MMLQIFAHFHVEFWNSKFFQQNRVQKEFWNYQVAEIMCENMSKFIKSFQHTSKILKEVEEKFHYKVEILWKLERFYSSRGQCQWDTACTESRSDLPTAAALLPSKCASSKGKEQLRCLLFHCSSSLACLFNVWPFHTKTLFFFYHNIAYLLVSKFSIASLFLKAIKKGSSFYWISISYFQK